MIELNDIHTWIGDSYILQGVTLSDAQQNRQAFLYASCGLSFHDNF